jgi:hypothetical protein
MNAEPQKRVQILEKQVEDLQAEVASLKKKKKPVKKADPPEVLNFRGLKEFTPLWHSWVTYKKEVHKERYKTIKSEQTALDRLFRLSRNRPDIAKAMLREAMELQWKGFFELKNNFNGNNKGNFSQKPLPTGEIAKGGFGSL